MFTIRWSAGGPTIERVGVDAHIHAGRGAGGVVAWVAGMARPLVAVIDSGVFRTAELDGVLKGEFDMAANPPRPDYAPRYDHGTMVATILNREAEGGVDILSFRIDDPAGCPADSAPPCQRSAAPIAAAIDKAVAMDVDAINLSLSLADDAAIVAAVQRATAKGVLVIMAAGNRGLDHPDNAAMARAGFPNAILVGALDKAGQPWTGTNRPDAGPNDYIYAWRPGVRVPTVTMAGRTVVGTGTSFAVPIETARRVIDRAESANSKLLAVRSR
jgi:subtilisin family serine protease